MDQKSEEKLLESEATVEVSRYENLPKPAKVVCLFLFIATLVLAVFSVFGFSFGGQVMLDTAYYYLLIALILPTAFLILPARKKDKQFPWYDLLFAVLAFGLPFYFFLEASAISFLGWVPPTPFQFALALPLFLLVLEGGRRAGGSIFIGVALVFGLYPLFAGSMPGMLWGLSFPFMDVIGYNIYSATGLVGIPIKVVGDILIGFLLFAGVMIASGAGDFFLKGSLALMGRFRGGPAKVAVVSSGFFGSLSGSLFANIAATGSVTIPTMKKIGYPPHYAGAIEACASTGGMLMPPVMGAVAFVMCMVIGVDYSVVIVAAAIPAILYYFGLLMQVDSYAARVGLRGLQREELPSLKKTLREGWPFITILFFLLWGLLYMRWETLAPFYASGLMLLLSFTSRKTMMTPRRIIAALVTVGKLISQTTAILLPVGFIMCGLNITGASLSFTAGLVHLGGGNIFLIMVVGVIACYLLGMAGMIIPAYIFLAVTMAPAAIEVGQLNVLAVHLFIVYYAMLAGITPPVALGAFMAANMAGTSPMRTALTAMRLGIVIYFIPFFFVFNPSLILEGSALETLYLFILCLLGIVLIAGGMEGYLVKIGKVGLLTRPLLVIAGILIGFPEWRTTIIGAVLAAVVITITLIRKRQQKSLKFNYDLKNY